MVKLITKNNHHKNKSKYIKDKESRNQNVSKVPKATKFWNASRELRASKEEDQTQGLDQNSFKAHRCPKSEYFQSRPQKVSIKLWSLFKQLIKRMECWPNHRNVAPERPQLTIYLRNRTRQLDSLGPYRYLACFQVIGLVKSESVSESHAEVLRD